MIETFRVIRCKIDQAERELNALADEYMLHLFIPCGAESDPETVMVFVKKPPAAAGPVMLDPRIFNRRGN